MPDERAALESKEVGRLQRDNAELKKSLLTQGRELPGGMIAEARPSADRSRRPTCPITSAKEPKGAERGRSRPRLRVHEEFWRRLVDLMVDLQRDIQRKS